MNSMEVEPPLLSEEEQTGGAKEKTLLSGKKRPNERPTDEDYAPLTEFIQDKERNKIYKREDLLGVGGFARVYRVVELGGVKLVDSLAGKVISKAMISRHSLADKIISKAMISRRSNFKRKVEKEIAIHSRMSHVNIVKMVCSFEDDSFIHIILENCTQRSLHDVIKARITVSEIEARYYVNQILQGVRYIHQQGFLHCDLKLANMLLSQDMVLKIGDFGLACSFEESHPGSMKGTPNFIAPEVLAKEGHGVAADIWSIGCMLFALLCGRPPFESSSLETTYEKICKGEYQIPDSVTAEAKSFINTMLAMKEEDRGHLALPGADSEHNLLTHPFLMSGFTPRKMPIYAATIDKMIMFDWFDGVTDGGPEHPDFRMKDPQTVPPDYYMNPEETELIIPIIEEDGRTHLPVSFSCQEQTVSTLMMQRHLMRQSKKFLERAIDNLALSTNRCNTEVEELNVVPVFIKRWVDYSNKYGFGFHLTDDTVGVHFNDKSRIATCGELIEIVSQLNDMVYVNRKEPEPDENYRNQIMVLDFVVDYMKDILVDRTANVDFSQHKIIATRSKSMITQMKRWKRSETSVVVELNNHLVQVNLLQENIEMVIWEHSSQMFLTMVNEKSVLYTYSVATLIQRGSPDHILMWIGHAIEQLTTLLLKREV